jgi:hypothetical protein
LEAAGCTLKDYYFALGPADVVVIYEAPDAVTAASMSMTLGATGTSSSVETIQLFTMEEAMAAMTKSGQVQRTYKPFGDAGAETVNRSGGVGSESFRQGRRVASAAASPARLATSLVARPLVLDWPKRHRPPSIISEKGR